MAAYVINFTDPSKLPFTVNPGETNGPGQIQSNTSLKVHGQGSTSYGENVNENFIKLLENFSNSTPPPFPIEGQHWFDSDEPLMKVYDGTQWVAAGKPSTGCPNGGAGPADPLGGQLWYDECGVEPPTMRVYDTTDSVWKSLGDRYLLREGDSATDHTNTMSGNFNINSNRIVNLADPVDGTDAISEQYGDGRYINTVGDAMTGFLTLHADPTLAAHPSNKSYVDERVIRAGDTMTGFLTLSANPTIALHATTKTYVDVLIAALEASKVSLDGSNSIMTGFLTLSANPTNNLHATTKTYVDVLIAALEATKISLDGSNSTMTGFLTLSADPISALHATTKTYVDGFIAGLESSKVSLNGSNSTMTGTLTLSTTLDPGVDAAAVSKKFVNDNFSRANPGSGTEKDGDVQTSGATVYVYAGGAWRQVYPALFSA